uniref:Steroid 5-alpha reductase C-terminal domain-containing protein n=1 Tax=Vitrella brassicaformis TaxID=1169539 RepID=A0A7S1K9P2_9ALVE|mmetsp:Transcript_4424/g.10188  ORF Transcript_4424/g.10188 Transcript_4424/m.10188 type:complete len:324 (+) Transcript_4424:100-1071(+)
MAAIEAFAFDTHYFFLTFLVTCAVQYTCFAIAYGLQFDKITDLSGASNFVINIIIPLILANTYFERQVLVTVFIVVTRLYLAGFLFYRVLQRKSDTRFDTFRSNFLYYFGFWTGQILWCWGSTLNGIFVVSEKENPSLGPTDFIGIVLFALGFICQVVSDVQKYIFRANPANRGIPCTTGLWAYSRHPNYFGEMVIWWAIFLMSARAIHESTDTWGWATVVSPIWTMILLLFLSGIPYAEGANLKRYFENPTSRPMIEAYQRDVSPVIPMPQVVYRNLPMIVKQVFLFEFPMYEYHYVPPDSTAAQAAAANGSGKTDQQPDQA